MPVMEGIVLDCREDFAFNHECDAEPLKRLELSSIRFRCMKHHVGDYIQNRQ